MSNTYILTGLMIPFIGTAAGSACVFFLKRDLRENIQRALTGFAAGVMVAASIWSLIVPAIEQEEDLGRLAFLPAFAGFWLGILPPATSALLHNTSTLLLSMDCMTDLVNEERK